MNEIVNYIKNNWKNTVRFHDKDEGTLIGLPFSYTVPCSNDTFQELYYWDTYFTNVGLILSDNASQAKNNVDNLLYLVKRFGFVLNGSRTGFLFRSQPPFLSNMVLDIYNVYKDKEWLLEAYNTLKIEYDFWQTKRTTPTGLNRYYGNDNININQNAHYYCERLNIEFPEDESVIEKYNYAFQCGAESGWDFSSRGGIYPHNFNFLDLNSLMYGFEKNMAFFADELSLDETENWEKKAEKRKILINKYMWNNEKKAFYDYDFVNDKFSEILSVATLYTMYTGLATEEQAKNIVDNLPKLEMDYGIACCEKSDELFNLQWDYPNGWPCLHYITIKALLNYGYKEDARRIATKYTGVIEKNYKNTGKLWEKYNVVTGDISVTTEYKTPEMMGWSAGVYLYCNDLLTK